MSEHTPRRGDDVDKWLKRQRDQRYPEGRAWRAINDLLDRYRECSDYGLSLDPRDDGRGDP